MTEIIEPATFKPADATRAILKTLTDRLYDRADKEFFDSWEAEISNTDAPLRAGSVIAAAFMQVAARYAVFGAECAGREARLKQWLALAEEHFIEAVGAVASARANAGIDIPGEPK